MSVFSVLNSINVNEHTETKDTGKVRLTYLSWAWAWAEVKKNYPDANYTIYENRDGWNYFTDGKTCWVKTGVTIEGLEHIEYLPVMDFRNQSIPAERVTSFDVNKAIQRSLTKAAARHGLGLYIYAGEDLPEDDKPSDALEPLPAGARITKRESKTTISVGSTENESVEKGNIYKMVRQKLGLLKDDMEAMRLALISKGVILEKTFGEMTLMDMKRFAEQAEKEMANATGKA